MNKFFYPIPGITPKRRLLRPTLAMCALLSAAIVRPVAASQVGPYAYEVTDSNQFGVLNLNTGVFTQTVVTSPTLAGLGEIGNTLYSASYGDTSFYGVNGVTGSLSTIGTTSGLNGGYYGVSSSGNTLYGLDSAGTLYSLNPSTAAATSIGATGINTSNGFAISTGSSITYASYGEGLYTVNTSTGALTSIGSTGVTATGEAGFDGLVYEDGTLYGVFAAFDSSANKLYSFDTSTGAATLIATVSGATGNVYGLAPTPEPGSLGLSALSLVLLLVGSAAYRRGRAAKTIA